MANNYNSLSDEEKAELKAQGLRFKELLEGMGFSNQEDKSLFIGKLINKDQKPYDPASISRIENGKMKIPLKIIDELTSTGNVTKLWLLRGEEGQPKPTEAPHGKFKRRIKGSGNVNFYDVDFEAGKGVQFYDDIRNSEPAYTMDVPDFAGCTAFRTYGKSMEPLIDGGSILFGTKENDWNDYLEYGQIYGIVLKTGKRLLKRIRKSSKGDDYFLLESVNPEFDERDIPVSMIKNIWLIHGWLNKRT